jgi:hypothetical protein
MSDLQTKNKQNKQNIKILPVLNSIHKINDDNTHLYYHPKTEKCVFNKHGQCIKGFRYFCPDCDYGMGGMFSSCLNIDCLNSYKFSDILEED